MFLGLTVLAFATYGVASMVGSLGPTSLILGLLVAALPLLLLRSKAVRRASADDVLRARDGVLDALRRPSLATFMTILYVVALAIGVWLVSDRTFFWDPEGLYIGNVNNLGDLPYHVQITASFAYGENFPPQNPVFAGSGFSYHYMADFLAAVFVAAGLDLVGGVLAVSLILSGALLPLIHRWARELTGNVVAARLTPLIVVFSGGLGFLTLFEQARVGEDGLLSTFVDGAERYTMAYEGILRFGNAVTALLIPQRGLLLGMGLAMIVLTLLWRHLDAPDPEPADPRSPRTWRDTIAAEPRMLVAGVITGVLPIVHVHTFAVVLGTAFFLGLVFREWRNRRWRPWVVYVLATLIAAAPVVLITARGSQANVGAFVGFELGWDRGTNDPISFWLVNAGVYIPLLLVGLFLAYRGRLGSRKLLLYTVPFLAWFILPNVLRLAPWLWDNIKVLIYWWIGCAPLVALVLARMWQDRAVGLKLASVGLAVVLMASGFLDVTRASIGPRYQEFDNDAVAFADLVRESTPPDSVILTAPSFNTPVFLTGRRVFMGYVGFLWANGLPYSEREADVKAIYAGGDGARQLLDEYGIEYVVVGPQERGDVAANESFFGAYPVVAQVGDYALHKVRDRSVSP